MGNEMQIWPEKGEDKILTVDRSVWDLVHKLRNTHGPETWEIARKVILADREVRNRAERLKRGDFTPEWLEAEGLASDIGMRSDGAVYRETLAVSDLLEEARVNNRAPTTEEINTLLQAVSKLTDELHKTDEMAVKLGSVLTGIKEANV